MLDLDIREKIAELLSSKISLSEFQEWFVSATWDIDHSPNKVARELAYELELILAEYTSGHLPENELRNELQSFLPAW